MTKELLNHLRRATAELACPRCQNRGYITTSQGPDECPECHGEKRNDATIALLEALTDHATGYVRKVQL